MERDDTLRRAEKLLRQGRLDVAIEEYASVVEAYPKDWPTANLLGDLFVRAGRTDRAVAQYGRIAEQLAADGFLSKAGALYKKILKITPGDEHALLRTAELASQQGLLADARHVLHTLFQRRVSAGDRSGAASLAERLAALDPNDVIGRLDAARMLAEIGDTAAAANHLRVAGDSLAGQGREADALRAWRESMRLNPANTLAQERVTSGLVRQGDLDGALASAQSVAERRVVAHAMLKAGRDEAGLDVLWQVLRDDPRDVDTRLQLAKMLMVRRQYPEARDLLTPSLQGGDARVDLALAETNLRSGVLPPAVAILTQLLARDPASVDHVAALGASLADERPDVAFVTIECAVDHLVGCGEFDAALKIVERFVAAEPRHVPALERFAQLCRTGRLDDALYHVESELTEAYLTHRRFGDALVVAERLAALRPDVDRHEAQMHEARAGLGEAATGAGDRYNLDRQTTESIDLEDFAVALGLPTHRDAETGIGDGSASLPIGANAASDVPPIVADAESVLPLIVPDAATDVPPIVADAESVLPLIVPDAATDVPPFVADAESVLPLIAPDAASDGPPFVADAESVLPLIAPDAASDGPPFVADAESVLPLIVPDAATDVPPFVADAESVLPLIVPDAATDVPPFVADAESVLPLIARDAESDVPPVAADADSVLPPFCPDVQCRPPSAAEVIEIELADALDALASDDAGGAGSKSAVSQDGPSREQADSPAELDDLFRRMRDESGRGQAEADATRAYDEAGVHYNEGRFDDAVECLRRAGRDPSLRFRATVMLARIATDRGQFSEAIAWFERAAGSPAPTVEAERALLYELGALLERAGEPVRAQAVFLELNATQPGYRDVAARLEALSDGRAKRTPELEGST